MSKIVFEGQRLDNGEWVKGDLLHNDNEHFSMVLIGHVIMSRDKYTDALSFDGFELYEVNPKTVRIVECCCEKEMSGIFYGLKLPRVKLKTIRHKNCPKPTGLKLGTAGIGKTFPQNRGAN